jgi:hypothetical protein
MVHFHPSSTSAHPHFEPNAVCAAIIAKVNEDGTLNLAVFDGNGASHTRTGVKLVQAGEDAPEGGNYAEWMPYQKSVASGTTEPVKHATPTPTK